MDFAKNKIIEKSVERAKYELRFKIEQKHKHTENITQTFLRYFQTYDFFDIRYISKSDYFHILLLLGILQANDKTCDLYVRKYNDFNTLFDIYQHNKTGYLEYHKFIKEVLYN